MRCPGCGATNTDTATFCGQCYERFDIAPVAADVGGAAETVAAVDSGEAPAARSDPAHPVAVGRFAAAEGGLTWRCALCDTSHSFGVFVCTVCGAKMDVEAREGSDEPVDYDSARRLEAAVPGLGHLRTGHTGIGAARGGIVVVWLLGSLVLASGGASGLLTALPMVLGMIVIWASGPADLEAARHGRPPRLDARRFMYLVIGVTTGVIIAGGLAVIL